MISSSRRSSRVSEMSSPGAVAWFVVTLISVRLRETRRFASPPVLQDLARGDQLQFLPEADGPRAFSRRTGQGAAVAVCPLRPAAGVDRHWHPVGTREAQGPWTTGSVSRRARSRSAPSAVRAARRRRFLPAAGVDRLLALCPNA